MTGDGHPHRPAVIIGSAAGSRRRLRSTDGRTAALSPCPARTNMTGERYQDLPAAKRRRVAFRAVLRGVLAAAVVVVLYYVLPLDRSWDSGTATRLLIGILVFAGVMVWQVRAIAGSRYPGLRAAGALGLILPLLPGAVRLHLLPDGTGLGGELHPAADPHRRLVLRGDRVLDGGFRGHHRQIRDCPGRAHRPDARRPRTSGRRPAGAPGRRATQPGTKAGYGR